VTLFYYKFRQYEIKPGHTPGHICLYHKETKTLIVGDAMNVIDGQLIGPNKQTMNEEDGRVAINSLKKFEEYDIENVISYQGACSTITPIKELKSYFKGGN
jgi:Metallo-beta-lactamase superfamily